MPRYPARMLPAGWQVSRRAEGWYLQHQEEKEGAWADMRGPYRKRAYAVEAWGRLETRRLLAAEKGAQGDDD